MLLHRLWDDVVFAVKVTNILMDLLIFPGQRWYKYNSVPSAFKSQNKREKLHKITLVIKSTNLLDFVFENMFELYFHDFELNQRGKNQTWLISKLRQRRFVSEMSKWFQFELQFWSTKYCIYVNDYYASRLYFKVVFNILLPFPPRFTTELLFRRKKTLRETLANNRKLWADTAFASRCHLHAISTHKNFCHFWWVVNCCYFQKNQLNQTATHMNNYKKWRSVCCVVTTRIPWHSLFFGQKVTAALRD